MNRDLVLALSAVPKESDIQELRGQLVSFNRSRVGPTKSSIIFLTLRDAEGQLRGGLSGKIYYNCLLVELLWVAEQSRGHGEGTALLQAAEKEARRRGCHQSWLSTFSFQAQGFYEKNGYLLFGELMDCPPGYTLHFFRKSLTID